MVGIVVRTSFGLSLLLPPQLLLALLLLVLLGLQEVVNGLHGLLLKACGYGGIVGMGMGMPGYARGYGAQQEHAQTLTLTWGIDRVIDTSIHTPLMNQREGVSWAQHTPP